MGRLHCVFVSRHVWLSCPTGCLHGHFSLSCFEEQPAILVIVHYPAPSLSSTLLAVWVTGDCLLCILPIIFIPLIPDKN